MAVLDGAEDRRFAPAVKRTALVLEQEGYPRLNHDQRADLAAALLEVLYVSRGAAGELEKRLNGLAAPLVSPDGTLDAYDCAAAGHELRRVKGAEGAIVIAVGPDGRVHVAVAAMKESSAQMDRVAERVITALVDGTPRELLESVVLDVVVHEDGRTEPC